MCSRCWRLYQTLLSLILPAENMDVLPRRKGCDGLGFGRKKKKKRRLDTSKKKCRGVPMSAVLKQIKWEIQPTLQHLILDVRHKHLLTWTHNIMTLDGFICSGECNPSTSPSPKTPKTPSMHYSYTSARFSLTCESLDVLRGLLYRTLFEGHYGMWQDVIHSAVRKKERVWWRSAAAAAAAAAAVALTDERPITGWVSSLCAGGESAVMAFTDGK